MLNHHKLSTSSPVTRSKQPDRLDRARPQETFHLPKVTSFRGKKIAAASFVASGRPGSVPAIPPDASRFSINDTETEIQPVIKDHQLKAIRFVFQRFFDLLTGLRGGLICHCMARP